MLQERLTRCQALADELDDPELLEAVCHLKLQSMAHERRDDALQNALEDFVQASEHCFRHCTHVYQTIYARVFRMLDRAGGAGDAATVEIDPTCALSVVQAEDPVGVVLYNDNETLAKLESSELAHLPQSEEECEALEEYYDEQAVILEQYQLNYQTLKQRVEALSLDALQVLQQVAHCRDALASLAHPSVLALAVALDQLEVAVKQPLERRRIQIANCQKPVDNACAKFLECARLKEKLLRSYYTERAHQRQPTRVESLF